MSSIRLGVLKDSVLSKLRVRCVSPLRPGLGGRFLDTEIVVLLSVALRVDTAFSIKPGHSKSSPWDWGFPEGQTLSLYLPGGISESRSCVSPHTRGSLKAGPMSLLLGQGLSGTRTYQGDRAGWVVERRLPRQNGGPTPEEGRKKAPQTASPLERCVIN